MFKKGNVPWNKGISHSEQTKEKIKQGVLRKIKGWGKNKGGIISHTQKSKDNLSRMQQERMEDFNLRKQISDKMKKIQRPFSLKKMTKPEKVMANILNRLNICWKFNHPVIVSNGQVYYPDFTVSFDKFKIAIEVDGVYWHRNTREKDKKRQSEIQSTSAMPFFRVSDIFLLKNQEKVEHSLNYYFSKIDNVIKEVN